MSTEATQAEAERHSAHQKSETAEERSNSHTVTRNRLSTWHIIALSSALHLVLLFYADHVDGHPERYGGLKYTDVDWRVVMDGARLIFAPRADEGAQGVVGRWFWEKGYRIGDPYRRQTFRYTPLLPLLTSPSLFHPLLGKILLSVISLAIPLLLLSGPTTSNNVAHGKLSIHAAAPFWATHLVWTLNPFVLNITTRGSPEAIIVFLVVLTMTLLRLSQAALAAPKASAGESESSKWSARRYEDAAAVVFALAISYKIYPIIYAPAFWAFLRSRHGMLGIGIWRFGVITAISLGVINGALYSVWGHPFLEHTFLYHIRRKDHRHNFSPYFYPIYLSLFAETPSSTHAYLKVILGIFRHPLTSFIPQATLVLGSGWLLTPVAGLPFAMFVQTVAFVIFNKVCTSQYFMWFLALIPPIIPQLHLSSSRASILVGIWIAGQAVWLGMAYRLELLAQDAFLAVWAAGIGLFGASVWALGELVDACAPI